MRKAAAPEGGVWLLVAATLALLVLASPRPPLEDILKCPAEVVGSQLAGFLVLVSGALAGFFVRRPRLMVASLAGLLIGLWQGPYIDRSVVEAGEWRRFSAGGADASARILEARWSQPQAMFGFLGGGGGHPTHILAMRLAFRAPDGTLRIAQTSERYPPVGMAARGMSDAQFRSGAIIEIRYLRSDPRRVHSRTYLNAFNPAPLSSPLFAALAPWLFAGPVLVGLGRRPPRRTQTGRDLPGS